MAKFRFQMSFEGIGPHKNTSLDEQVNSINMAIYADNGSGKTFISKSFKRINDYQVLDQSNEKKVACFQTKNDAMIRFGETLGKMKVIVTPEQENSMSLEVSFAHGQFPTIKNDMQWIIHVFNSEYIKENLEAVKYHPEDNVHGFILGKVNIDLSKEKQQLSDLQLKKNEMLENVKKFIDSAQLELKHAGVQRNTKEFSNITFLNVLNGKKTKESRRYVEIKQKYDTLNQMPENIPDISYPKIDSLDNIFSVIQDVESVLTTVYSPCNLADEFKKQIKDKQNFVEQGIIFSDGKQCPFCGQEYSDGAIKLIDAYNSFLNDAEATVLRKIDKLIRVLDDWCEKLKTLKKESDQAEITYSALKSYFPSLESIELDVIDVAILEKTVHSIQVYLEEKKKNISIGDFNIDSNKAILNDKFDVLKESCKKNMSRISTLNSNKNDISTERLILRRALCNSKCNELIDDLTVTIEDFKKISVEESDLAEKIKTQEEQVRMDKRLTVITELKRYLHIFFNDKYEFDEKEFCIKFQNRVLIDNTEDVLSDGEKSILAFCFFMANIHGVVSHVDDYEKLFLIIDDPVSSMDFNYVYNVAQVIRDIKKDEKIQKVRYIVLTHNMEFMGILVKNRIIQQKYLLSNGKFNVFKNDFVLPYIANLKDIYLVAQGKMPPSHTLPNSIRHVLETIHRFEGAVDKFEDYLFKDEILKESAFLYTLINDLSHGGFRYSKGYTPEMLIEGCNTVINFISKKYSGQLSEIKSLLG